MNTLCGGPERLIYTCLSLRTFVKLSVTSRRWHSNAKHEQSASSLATKHWDLCEMSRTEREAMAQRAHASHNAVVDISPLLTTTTTPTTTIMMRDADSKDSTMCGNLMIHMLRRLTKFVPMLQHLEVRWEQQKDNNINNNNTSGKNDADDSECKQSSRCDIISEAKEIWNIVVTQLPKLRKLSWFGSPIVCDFALLLASRPIRSFTLKRYPFPLYSFRNALNLISINIDEESYSNFFEGASTGADVNASTNANSDMNANDVIHEHNSVDVGNNNRSNDADDDKNNNDDDHHVGKCASRHKPTKAPITSLFPTTLLYLTCVIPNIYHYSLLDITRAFPNLATLDVCREDGSPLCPLQIDAGCRNLRSVAHALDGASISEWRLLAPSLKKLQWLCCEIAGPASTSLLCEAAPQLSHLALLTIHKCADLHSLTHLTKLTYLSLRLLDVDAQFLHLPLIRTSLKRLTLAPGCHLNSDVVNVITGLSSLEVLRHCWGHPFFRFVDVSPFRHIWPNLLELNVPIVSYGGDETSIYTRELLRLARIPVATNHHHTLTTTDLNQHSVSGPHVSDFPQFVTQIQTALFLMNVGNWADALGAQCEPRWNRKCIFVFSTRLSAATICEHGFSVATRFSRRQRGPFF